MSRYQIVIKCVSAPTTGLFANQTPIRTFLNRFFFQKADKDCSYFDLNGLDTNFSKWPNQTVLHVCYVGNDCLLSSFGDGVEFLRR